MEIGEGAGLKTGDDDYVTYTDGEKKTADAVYDADTNDVDEGDLAVEGKNINTVSEEHTAKETLYGSIMTMAEWKAAGSKPGAYWVWDENGRALIISKDTLETRQFDASSPKLQTSEVRTYMNGEWLDKYPTLKAIAKDSEITTRSSDDKTAFDTTTDKFFFLSEADLYGTQDGNTAQAQDYTFGSKLPAPGGSWIAKYEGKDSIYWLRSPRENGRDSALVLTIGNVFSYGWGTTYYGVRPALWVDMA